MFLLAIDDKPYLYSVGLAANCSVSQSKWAMRPPHFFLTLINDWDGLYLLLMVVFRLDWNPRMLDADSLAGVVSSVANTCQIGKTHCWLFDNSIGEAEQPVPRLSLQGRPTLLAVMACDELHEMYLFFPRFPSKCQF